MTRHGLLSTTAGLQDKTFDGSPKRPQSLSARSSWAVRSKATTHDAPSLAHSAQKNNTYVRVDREGHDRDGHQGNDSAQQRHPAPLGARPSHGCAACLCALRCLLLPPSLSPRRVVAEQLCSCVWAEGAASAEVHSAYHNEHPVHRAYTHPLSECTCYLRLCTARAFANIPTRIRYTGLAHTSQCSCRPRLCTARARSRIHTQRCAKASGKERLIAPKKPTHM